MLRLSNPGCITIWIPHENSKLLQTSSLLPLSLHSAKTTALSPELLVVWSSFSAYLFCEPLDLFGLAAVVAIILLGRDVKDHLVPTSLPWAGTPCSNCSSNSTTITVENFPKSTFFHLKVISSCLITTYPCGESS